MMHIAIPAPVQVKNLDGSRSEVVIDFATFVRTYVIADNRFNAGAQEMRMGLSLDLALCDAAPGAEVSVDDAWHKKAMECLDAPTAGQFPHPSFVVRQLLAHFDAFATATKTPRAAPLEAPAN